MKLLRPDQLDLIDRRLRQVIRQRFDAPEVAPMREHVLAYVLHGGKRIRPQLTIWLWQLLAGRDVDEAGADGGAAVLDAACAWELFHAFLLAHDDIIDNSDTRRGADALHRRLAALDGNTKRFGINMGIVAGDLLYSLAGGLMHDLPGLEPARHLRVLRAFGEVARVTGFGQAVDIVSGHVELGDVDEAALMREYGWKTAAYTFEGPMLTAALLAGSDEATLGRIRRYAMALGRAYQLHNDLLDLSTPVTDEGGDLLEGKRTLTLVRARRSVPDLDRRMSELRGSPDRAEALRQDLLASGAIDETRGLIQDCVRDSADACDDLPDPLQSGMRELLTQIDRRYLSTI